MFLTKGVGIHKEKLTSFEEKNSPPLKKRCGVRVLPTVIW
jgi:hypothetical protein